MYYYCEELRIRQLTKFSIPNWTKIDRDHTEGLLCRRMHILPILRESSGQNESREREMRILREGDSTNILIKYPHDLSDQKSNGYAKIHLGKARYHSWRMTRWRWPMSDGTEYSRVIHSRFVLVQSSRKSREGSMTLAVCRPWLHLTSSIFAVRECDSCWGHQDSRTSITMVRWQTLEGEAHR